ncbi:hypothetical protein D3C81_2274030 [compost metagenome]
MATVLESSPDSSMWASVSLITGSGTETLDRNSVSLGASCENLVFTAVKTGLSG